MFKNGKLFGKFNIIDALTILVIAAAVITLAFHFISKKAAEANQAAEDSLKLNFSVLCSGYDQQVYDYLSTSPDKQIFIGSRLKEGYVTNVTFLEKDQETNTVSFQVDVSCTPVLDNGAYNFANQFVMVGANYNVKTLRYDVTGKIIAMEEIHE